MCMCVVVKLFITNSRVLRKILGPKMGGGGGDWGLEKLPSLGAS